jgi:peptide deformylase
MIEFLTPDNKLLYIEAKEVYKRDLNKKWFLDSIADMKLAAGLNQTSDKNKSIMLGLAAPQIGHPYKIAFINLAAEKEGRDAFGDNLFVLNPRIVQASKAKSIGHEGCYSVGIGNEAARVSGIVSRHDWVLVEYMDLSGNIQTRRFSGFTAVIFQHEIDHLGGKVFVHRIKQEKNLHIVFESENKLYKKNFEK